MHGSARKEKRKNYKEEKILGKITLCGCRYRETKKEKVSGVLRRHAV